MQPNRATYAPSLINFSGDYNNPKGTSNPRMFDRKPFKIETEQDKIAQWIIEVTEWIQNGPGLSRTTEEVRAVYGEKNFLEMIRKRPEFQFLLDKSYRNKKLKTICRQHGIQTYQNKRAYGLTRLGDRDLENLTLQQFIEKTGEQFFRGRVAKYDFFRWANGNIFLLSVEEEKEIDRLTTKAQKLFGVSPKIKGRWVTVDDLEPGDKVWAKRTYDGGLCTYYLIVKEVTDGQILTFNRNTNSEVMFVDGLVFRVGGK